MFRTFREIFSEEANRRFNLKGTPDEHTLLCLKMNPFLDMSPAGPFGKRATQELMEGRYKTALRMRLRHRQAAASSTSASTKSASSSSAPTPAPRPASTSASTPSPGAAQPPGGKRIKMMSLSSRLYLKAPVALDSEETTITIEIEAYNAFCTTADLSKYASEEGRIDLNSFWSDHRKALPIHYLVYLGDCASKRASSAAVETVYSGATKLSDEAQMMADDMLAAYVFNHYNWQYEFLRPTVAEIVQEYLTIHGQEVPEVELEAVQEETETTGTVAGAADEDGEAAEAGNEE